MKLFRANSDRPRHDASWGADEAWVIRVARALLRRARQEEAGPGGDGLWDSGLDPSSLRVDGRSPVDASRTHRLVVQSVMELPAEARDAILDRFRDNRRLETMARARQVRPMVVERELAAALDAIGERVRRSSGGGRAVYLASLALVVRELRPTLHRPLRARGPLAAAALVLVAIGAMLFERDLGDRPGPDLSATGDEVVADDRVLTPVEQAGADEQLAHSEATDDPVLVAVAAEGGVQLVGQVVDATGAPLEISGRGVGLVRGAGPGAERAVTVDSLGRFSMAGLRPGTWTLTAQVAGYVTVREEFEVAHTGDDVFTAELITRRAERIAVEVYASSDGLALDAVPVHEVPGSADDWAIAHGLSVAMTRLSPGERLPSSQFGSTWNHLSTFERMAPADLAQPALIGTLVAARPEAARQVHLLFGDYVLASVDWQPGVDVVRFDVDMERIDALRASVALQLKSLLDLDVAGAQVTLIGPHGQVIVRRLGPDGMLDLSGLPPGSWTVEIWLRRHGRVLRAFELGDGQNIEGEEIEIGGSIPLSGSVIDLAGNPIGALVRALPLNGLEHPLLYEQAPTTNTYPLGKAKFDFGEELSGGNDWVVVLDEPGYALQAKVVGEKGANVKFKAEKGQDVTLTWTPGAADSGSFALLVDQQGLPLKVIALSQDLFFSVQLSDGSYNLVLWTDGVWDTQIPFQVDGSKVSVPLD